MKPSWIEFRVPFVVIDFGVKWQIYEPEVFVSSSPWVDGPYCPKCDEELVEKNRGLIFKKNLWTCQKCEKDYDKPKGDLKDQVEKNFFKKKRQGRLH